MELMSREGAKAHRASLAGHSTQQWRFVPVQAPHQGCSFFGWLGGWLADCLGGLVFGWLPS